VVKTARAPIDSFCERLRLSLTDGTFVRLVLTQAAIPNTPSTRAVGRVVELRSGPNLSVHWQEAQASRTENVAAAQAHAWLRERLRREVCSVLIETTRANYQWQGGEAGGAGKWVRHAATASAPGGRSHDQPRQTLLDSRAHDWLQGLEVVDSTGRVRSGMADKHRQISRYLELFSHWSADGGWSPTSPLPAAGLARPRRVIADMGCGKAYLTFGVWHLFQRIWQCPVRVIGVEARADLVTKTSRLAREIGAVDLEFLVGQIETVALPPLDGLVALHACDTATDRAIRRGVEGGATLIVVAPCCHRQVRSALVAPRLLSGILRHGLMEERWAEWATDALRILYLEWAGYEVKTVDFVAPEHTPKNLMIAAIRTRAGGASPERWERLQAFKTWLGLREFPLDGLVLPARSAPADSTEMNPSS
jgi:SAM-dependent methyltransferase